MVAFNLSKSILSLIQCYVHNTNVRLYVFSSLYQPSRGEYGLMVKYYARRGDMHRARETFESMRARGIEPTSYVYTR